MRKSMKQLIAVTIAGVGLNGAPVLADDAALYGPAAPPGSSFIRLFNAAPQRLDDSRVGSKGWNKLDQNHASDFVFLPAGTHELVVGGQSLSVEMRADTYYTAIFSGAGLIVHELQPPEDRLKALVVLYNASSTNDLALKTEDGSADIAGADSGAFAKREVNPVRVPVALFESGKKLASSGTLSLARGRAFSLFVTDGRDEPHMTWVKD